MARRNASRSTAARSSTSRAGWSLFGFEHEGLVDSGGLGEVDDHAGAALHDQAVAERLDQAAAVFTGAGRELEGHLRHVDDHPIRVGEREGADIDLVAEIDDQPGLRSRRRRLEPRWRRGNPRSGGVCGPAAPARSEAQEPPRRAMAIRTAQRAARIDIEFPEPFPAPSYSIRGAWLTVV